MWTIELDWSKIFVKTSTFPFAAAHKNFSFVSFGSGKSSLNSSSLHMNNTTFAFQNLYHHCDSSRIILIIYRKKKKSEKTLRK